MSAAELEVGEEDSGSRLDVFLVRRVEGMSRAKARRLIEDGEVRVDGRRARKGARVMSGERVSLGELPAPADFAALPDPAQTLVVRYEDAHLVVVDKSAGVPTHPLRPHETRTLVGALLVRYPEMAHVGYAQREPGILHRLDNDTSGLVLAARSVQAFDILRIVLQQGRIDKRYLALVEGTVSSSVIDAPIAPHPTDPRRVHACMDPMDRGRAKARPARTEILRAERHGRFSLLEISASVAVRHQIRAHLAAVGHPLAGDRLYGGPEVEGLGGHFLHASRLTFDHPLERQRVDVASPLPAPLQAVLDRLR
jgi:23S rRNA pseudouridine1911/1915/1917 synthase